MIDIRQVRDQLNELTFESGQRRTCIGRVSELFPEQDEASVSSQIEQIVEQLHSHDLKLARGDDDLDELFAVQELKYREVDLTWMAKAMQWVSRITTVALEMVLPAVVGFWLDQRFETGFLGLGGLMLGVPLGVWHLLHMTKAMKN